MFKARGLAVIVLGLSTAAFMMVTGLASARADELSDLRVNQQLLQDRLDQLAQQPGQSPFPTNAPPGTAVLAGSFPRSFLIPGTDTSIRVGGNVQATRLLTSVKPLYPPGAEAAGIEGTVLLHAVISTQGDLLSISLMSTAVDGELAKAAMDAVQQWHYQPTLLNGAPVEVVTTIAVTFRLD